MIHFEYVNIDKHVDIDIDDINVGTIWIPKIGIISASVFQRERKITDKNVWHIGRHLLYFLVSFSLSNNK